MSVAFSGCCAGASEAGDGVMDGASPVSWRKPPRMSASTLQPSSCDSSTTSPPAWPATGLSTLKLRMAMDLEGAADVLRAVDGDGGRRTGPRTDYAGGDAPERRVGVLERRAHRRCAGAAHEALDLVERHAIGCAGEDDHHDEAILGESTRAAEALVVGGEVDADQSDRWREGVAE